ncbi:small ubiquitin-related modifier 2-like [Elaeis guineensis]|uniref:small ubiquitin-related modifier 2-like n=1 Tax=Elaeis guineensis var. tenera TaxID=51953 RepID=UPI003C6D8D81
MATTCIGKNRKHPGGRDDAGGVHHHRVLPDNHHPRIKRSTQLRKLTSAYCDRQSLDFNSIEFLPRASRGGDPEELSNRTISILEVEDRNEIGAMLHQTEGGL